MVEGKFSRTFDDFRKENEWRKRNSANVVKLAEISQISLFS
jgi:hypothetical protein